MSCSPLLPRRERAGPRRSFLNTASKCRRSVESLVPLATKTLHATSEAVQGVKTLAESSRAVITRSATCVAFENEYLAPPALALTRALAGYFATLAEAPGQPVDAAVWLAIPGVLDMMCHLIECQQSTGTVNSNAIVCESNKYERQLSCTQSNLHEADDDLAVKLNSQKYWHDEAATMGTVVKGGLVATATTSVLTGAVGTTLPAAALAASAAVPVALAIPAAMFLMSGAATVLGAGWGASAIIQRNVASRRAARLHKSAKHWEAELSKAEEDLKPLLKLQSEVTTSSSPGQGPTRPSQAVGAELHRLVSTLKNLQCVLPRVLAGGADDEVVDALWELWEAAGTAQEEWDSSVRGAGRGVAAACDVPTDGRMIDDFLEHHRKDLEIKMTLGMTTVKGILMDIKKLASDEDQVTGYLRTNSRTLQVISSSGLALSAPAPTQAQLPPSGQRAGGLITES